MKAFLKKYRSWIYLALISAAIAVAVFLLSGCATKPPTAFEARLYDITTNRVPSISTQTNIVTLTNVVGVPVFQTNVVLATNYSEAYVYKPGAGAQAAKETGTAIGDLFGVGGLVGTALGGLFSLYGYLRSKKSYATATSLVQGIETIREFVKQLPNGPTIDAQLTNWLTVHQAEQGVLDQVVALLQKETSNPNARVAAEHIRAVLASLNPPVVAGQTPPGTI